MNSLHTGRIKTLLYQGVWTSSRKSPLTLNFSFKYCQLDPLGAPLTCLLLHPQYPLSSGPASHHVLPGRFRK
jgi:hypothetical protein